MNRTDMWRRIEVHPKAWDMIVVGGGATGVGVAIDAATRGYDVLLLEQSDFGKGTSSRSTKLAHGGVRYLEQGNIGLVMEALQERGLLLQNAPHIVHDLAFVVPNYDWWEAPFYGLGLKLYQLLAGKYGFGVSRILSKEETLEHLPTLKTEGLRGGAVYYDGQFDDARLLIHMVVTAFEQGATLLNYVEVRGLTKDAQGFVDGVKARDIETGNEFRAAAKVVVNATGAFSDLLRLKAEPSATPMIAPSQGIHLVFESSFLQGESAVMVPHTSDGRVLFAIPWHGHTLVGTTDTPIAAATLEPVAMEQEIEFILATAGQYLTKAPTRDDVLSVFAGIRPLVGATGVVRTAALSRDHVIHIDRSGLVTVCGGKWTTYRHMAEDCVDQAATLAQLREQPCVTHHLRIHGFHEEAKQFGSLAVYGSDAYKIRKLIETDARLREPLHAALPYVKAEVLWAVRHEMARTVEDVLARRTRALFLDACAALAMAPAVADLMAPELGWDEVARTEQLAAFRNVASNYVLHF
ncbi:MAG TPA: FAD-dependent oxidoreductase [Terriglobales bacterium]|jgi:glycerol-3-phosphate dehydrogenase|nr:FAD-dependent oxidoreductase [Terriglobales bacterium]